MSSSFQSRLGTAPEEAIKAPCRAATTANITLSGEQTIDGVSVVAGDRVFVKNQAVGVENGIYVVQIGRWTRAPDWDGPGDVVSGILISVTEGTISGEVIYMITFSGSFTVGSSTFTVANAVSVETNAKNITYEENTGDRNIAMALDHRVPFVDTLSDLQALDISEVSDQARLDILGRASANDAGASEFRFRSGDQSANVTAEPERFLPPDDDATGASGAWELIHFKKDRVGSIFDLVSIPTAALFDGQTLDVRAFYANTDTGGGHFYWDADRNKSDANGGTIIDPDNVGTLSDTSLGTFLSQQGTGSGTGCWVCTDERINVLGWGAKGDGATDDSASIQAAIDSGENVYIPAGNYVASVDIGIRDIHVFGDSWDTVLIPPDASPYCIGINAVHVHLSWFYVDLPDAYTGYGIRTQTVAGASARHLRFEYVRVVAPNTSEACIYISTDEEWTGYNELVNCNTIGAKIGFLDDSSNILRVESGEYSSSGFWGVSIGGSNAYVTNITLANNGGDVDTSLDYRGDQGGGIRMSGLRSEVSNAWVENNVTKWGGARPDSFYAPQGSEVIFSSFRNMRIGGFAEWFFLEEEIASNKNVKFIDNGGLQLTPPAGPNYLTNPLLLLDGSGNLLGNWSIQDSSQTVTRSTNAPNGFKESAKLVNNASNTFLWNPLNDSVIIGNNELTLAFWLYWDRSEGENINWTDSDDPIRVGISQGSSAGDLEISKSIRTGPRLRPFDQQWIYYQATIDISDLASANVIITNSNNSTFYVAGISVSTAGTVGQFAS